MGVGRDRIIIEAGRKTECLPPASNSIPFEVSLRRVVGESGLVRRELANSVRSGRKQRYAITPGCHEGAWLCLRAAEPLNGYSFCLDFAFSQSMVRGL